MDKELLQILGGSSAIIAAVAAVGKYLISSYFKQQGKMEALKERYISNQINALKEMTERFSKSLHLVEERMILITERVGNNQKNYEAVMEALKEFVHETDIKFKDTHSEIQRIGSDLIMVKSTLKNRRN